jgi:hypothetical protein
MMEHAKMVEFKFDQYNKSPKDLMDYNMIKD